MGIDEASGQAGNSTPSSDGQVQAWARGTTRIRLHSEYDERGNCERREAILFNAMVRRFPGVVIGYAQVLGVRRSAGCCVA